MIVWPLLVAVQANGRSQRDQGEALQRPRLKRSLMAFRAPGIAPESFQVKPDG
jgi:hypothetical protein